jgi:hypothetical protein
VIIIERLPDFPPPPTFGLSPAATSFYPLPSGFDQYPVFYDITTIPEGMGARFDRDLVALRQPGGLWRAGLPGLQRENR